MKTFYKTFCVTESMCTHCESAKEGLLVTGSIILTLVPENVLITIIIATIQYVRSACGPIAGKFNYALKVKSPSKTV